MKNVTLSLPDEVYRRGRIVAAERGKSLSGLVAEYLEGISKDREEFELYKARLQELIHEVPEGFSAADRLSREELYRDRGLR